MQQNVERLLIGAALTVAATALLPIARSTLKPLAERAGYMLRVARDEAEDIVAEAQFERMRKRIDREIQTQ